jgi:hypothetical protein
MKTSGGQATGRLFMVQGVFNLVIFSYYALWIYFITLCLAVKTSGGQATGKLFMGQGF